MYFASHTRMLLAARPFEMKLNAVYRRGDGKTVENSSVVVVARSHFFECVFLFSQFLCLCLERGVALLPSQSASASASSEFTYKLYIKIPGIILCINWCFFLCAHGKRQNNELLLFRESAEMLAWLIIDGDEECVVKNISACARSTDTSHHFDRIFNIKTLAAATMCVLWIRCELMVGSFFL